MVKVASLAVWNQAWQTNQGSDLAPLLEKHAQLWKGALSCLFRGQMHDGSLGRAGGRATDNVTLKAPTDCTVFFFQSSTSVHRRLRRHTTIICHGLGRSIALQAQSIYHAKKQMRKDSRITFLMVAFMSAEKKIHLKRKKKKKKKRRRIWTWSCLGKRGKFGRESVRNAFISVN